MLKKVSFVVLIILFALLPFNALLTNWISFGLNIKLPVNAWKEILVIGLTLCVAMDIIWHKRKISLDKLDWLILAFFALGIISALFQTQDLGRILFGFKYDFEFLWLFLLLRHNHFFSARENELLIKVVLVSACVVVAFGLLQIFVLPKDFLLLFGYSSNISSWYPGGPLPMYHAVDTHADIPRIASTLSGPNQLSSYLLIFIFIGLAALWKTTSRKKKVLWGLFCLAVLIILVFTYSRSAYGAFLIALIVGYFILVKNKKRLLSLFLCAVGLVVIGIGSILVWQPETFSQLLLRASSSQGHLERSWDGVIHTFQNPLGHGIGNAGPASARFNADLIGWIPENWYLQISLELGVLGVILFIGILIITLRQLLEKYSSAKDHLALALFLSLLALSLTSLLLHSWEESAVALTFWGLAGLVLNRAKDLKSPKNNLG